MFRTMLSACFQHVMWSCAPYYYTSLYNVFRALADGLRQSRLFISWPVMETIDVMQDDRGMRTEGYGVRKTYQTLGGLFHPARVFTLLTLPAIIVEKLRDQSSTVEQSRIVALRLIPWTEKVTATASLPLPTS